MLGQRAVVSLRLRPLTRLPRPFRSSCQPASAPLALCIRTYSTPGRPRKAVGEPSRPVRRGVKRAATKASTSSASSTTAKQAGTATRKRAAAKASAPKEKKAVKKAAPTAEQVEKAKQRKAKLKAKVKADGEVARVKELKKSALEPPARPMQYSAWMVFCDEKLSALRSGKSSDRADHNAKFTEVMKATGADFHALAPAEREHYNHIAHTKTDARSADYKQWVASHSVDEIQAANAARRNLRRRFPTGKGKHSRWLAIVDERFVPETANLNPYAQYTRARHASGDLKGIAVVEAAKLIANEWKSLSAVEKQKYQAVSASGGEPSSSQYKLVYGNPSSLSSGGQQTAAAAA